MDEEAGNTRDRVVLLFFGVSIDLFKPEFGHRGPIIDSSAAKTNTHVH